MSDLRTRILALTDDEAIALLHRLARALTAGALNASSIERQVRELAEIQSLPYEPTVPMAPGDLARSALLMLADDDRYAPSISSTLNATRSTFSPRRDDNAVEGTALLTVLRTQLPTHGSESALASPSNVHRQPGLFGTLTRQLMGMTGLNPTPMQSDAEYRVWFATSRRPLDAQDLSKGFGTDRDILVHHGDCRVFVPRSHQVGSTGSGWWKRALLRTDDRLKLLATTPLDPDAFWGQVSRQLTDNLHDDRDAVVFIHGYNVDFNEAALRAAQIGFDLQVRGAMAFYSWASRGTLAGYPADAATIELEEAPIADFLCDMASRSGARKVHVIAHSMGNRAVLRAMNRIVLQAGQRGGVRFGQVVLAAADVDTRKFMELCPAYGHLAERTTLYVSARDFPVNLAQWLYNHPRVGLMPPVTVAPGIDTIDASSTDLTLLGHGYVAETREVVSDIHALIRHGKAPQSRFNLRASRTPGGDPYWLIGA